VAARYDLDGKAALVTGGARGIGLATARALVARGASVVIVDLDQQAADAAARQVHETRAIGIAGDVTDRGAMQRAVATAVERFGGLDVVVANAGIASRAATYRAMSGEAFDRVLDVNLADPLADDMFATFPAPLLKRLAPQAAGEAIVRGIERRRAQIIAPRRWTLMALLRGIVGPLGDARAVGDAETQRILRALDARGDEEQPTTA